MGYVYLMTGPRASLVYGFAEPSVQLVAAAGAGRTETEMDMSVGR